MKNLFDFATKELSQDAFLRWLFESYDSEDEELKEASRRLVIQFINKDNDIQYTTKSILKLWTKAQDHNADIVVWVSMDDNKTYGIIIEDKTFSSEHNQLRRYKHIFENDKWWEAHTKSRKYIFYKTSFVQDWEKKNVREASWDLYDISRINEFWKEYLNSTNLLLNWYAKHVDKLLCLYSNTELISDERNSKYNACAWFGFFNNVLRKRFENEFKIYVETSTYGYTYITFRPLIDVASENNTPYLEIASRDLYEYDKEGKIIGINLITKWLIYGMDWKFKESTIEKYVTLLRECIDNYKDSLFICDRKLSKQIAHTNKVKIKSKEDFILRLEEVLNAYKYINESAKLSSLDLEYTYNKSLDEKVKIVEAIKNKLDKVTINNFECKEIGCYNTNLVYKSYFSLYANIEEKGLTLESYIMFEPTSKEYNGFQYEKADTLYVALWNRSDREYNFDRFISSDSKLIVTSGRNCWGKHYILKTYDLKADSTESIIENATNYIRGTLENINKTK